MAGTSSESDFVNHLCALFPARERRAWPVPWLWLIALFGGLVAIGDESGQPYQFRDPEQFWLHRAVFQKRGIVIEDADYIVREKFWILDRTVTGQVIGVKQLDKGKGVDLTVRFHGMESGWQAEGIAIRDRVVTKTERTVTIRPDAYGDGVNVDTDEVSFSHRIEGEKVEPHRCGLIVRHEGDVVVVRFPSSLVSLVSPNKGDRVVRSFDWEDGFADGGAQPRGRDSESSDDCYGIVERPRDEDGFIDVRWERTGRRKRHRFDHCGYYDVQPVDLADELPQ